MRRFAVVLMIVLGGCHGDNATRVVRLSAPADVAALAGDAAAALETQHGGIVSDDAFAARMRELASRIVAANPSLMGAYRFYKLGDSAVNAFSLPPGRIYLTCGLYQRMASDDQLAAVICHEIAHIQRHDHFLPRCANAEAALQREIDADRDAAQYLRAAEIDARALEQVVELIRDVQATGWADRRIAALTETTIAGRSN